NRRLGPGPRRVSPLRSPPPTNSERTSTTCCSASSRGRLPMPDGYTKGPATDVKRPLFRELPPAPEFPLQALGELRSAADAIHDMTLAPVAVCAQSALAAATLAVQAHRDVE